MVARNLAEWVRAQESIVGTFREQGGRGWRYRFVPPEQTNWIDEQRAQVEACALGDLSHHMTAVHLEGPDAVRLLEELCINGFDEFEIGRGKQIVMCSHDGYVIGDGPLLRFGEDEFYTAGLHGTKWLQWNLETGSYDVSVEIEPPTPLLPDETPERFVYQVQGPTTYDVLDELTDDDVRDIGFYAFEEITLAGRNVIAFGHGMSTEPGFEFVGPYEYADEIRDAFVDSGREYGLRLLGTNAMTSQSVKIGWWPAWIKPVYHGEEMREYREWVDVEKEHEFGKAYWSDEEPLETSLSIEGSFDSDDIRDYYFTPVELGYGHLVDFDHDFIGKAAVRRELEDPAREKVALFWDDDDVARVNRSIFGDGESYKFMGNRYPFIEWARQPMDKVLVDGRLVGKSLGRAFQWDTRGIVSQCVIDSEYSDLGTEVTVVWGEPGGESPNPAIENHVQTRIRATVQPAPYNRREK